MTRITATIRHLHHGSPVEDDITVRVNLRPAESIDSFWNGQAVRQAISDALATDEFQLVESWIPAPLSVVSVPVSWPTFDMGAAEAFAEEILAR